MTRPKKPKPPKASNPTPKLKGTIRALTGIPSISREVTRGIRNVPKERSLPRTPALPKGTPKIKAPKVRVKLKNLVPKLKRKKA